MYTVIISLSPLLIFFFRMICCACVPGARSPSLAHRSNCLPIAIRSGGSRPVRAAAAVGADGGRSGRLPGSSDAHSRPPLTHARHAAALRPGSPLRQATHQGALASTAETQGSRVGGA